jgi:uncharacterized protein (UPF0276 family)
MSWSRLDLGVGLIALAGIDLLWNEIEDLVDAIEVEPQTIWESQPSGGWELSEEACAYVKSLNRPVLSHGVGFPVGGMLAPDNYGVDLAAESTHRLSAVHWSEHLSFNRATDRGQTIQAGFLLPPVQAPDVVNAAVRNIAHYQAKSHLPFLIETPTSYMRPVEGDMSDGQFLARVAEEADCGILLDLHNIWANERNGRQTVDEFLSELPLERVWEVHLAGGYEMDGYYLDAHCGPACPELLAIAQAVVPRLPKVRALMFEAVPESLVTMGSIGVRPVLETLHELAELALPGAENHGERQTRPSFIARPSASQSPLASSDREAELVRFIIRKTDLRPDNDIGADILRFLTDQARLGLITVSRPGQLRTLLERYGVEETERMLEQFLEWSGAEIWTASAASAFDAWWESGTLDQPNASGRRIRGISSDSAQRPTIKASHMTELIDSST